MSTISSALTEMILEGGPSPKLKKELIRKTALSAREKERRSRVYFIQAEDGPIKIGFTLDVDRRIKRMQMDCPLKLYLIGVIKGNVSLETKIHRKFKKHRIRGEWFKPHENIIKYIQDNSVKLKNYKKLIKYLKR